MQKQHKLPNRNKIHLMLDSAMFIAFLVAQAPRFSGQAIHEWLGIAFGAAIVTHVLLNWEWIVGVTRRFVGKVQWSARINYALNTLLFIDITVIVFTGLMISETALPLLGIRLPQNGIWRVVHTTAANLSVFLIGAHLRGRRRDRRLLSVERCAGHTPHVARAWRVRGRTIWQAGWNQRCGAERRQRWT